MKQITHWTGLFALRCVFAFLIAQMAIPSALAAELTYEQQQAAWQDFSNWDKSVGVSSKAFQELMGSDETKAIFDDYGNAVLVINVSKELLHSGDLAAAARIIKDKLQDKVIERITPGFHAWLGWIMWAKAGMELFKDFVFDPMVEGSQLDTYYGMRAAGNEPEDAFAGVRGYGYIVERAKKEFRKQYGDLPFQAGSNELLPKWEANCLRFAKASMETKYQEKLHKEAIEKYRAAAVQAEAQLLDLRERVLLLLKQSQVERLELDPPQSEIRVGEQVTISAVAIFADHYAPRSAADITGECTWSGGTDDNVFTAKQSDIGKTVVIIAKYAGVTGTASVTVVDTDCGDNGRWNVATERCDCDSGFQWSDALFECIGDGDTATADAKEVLGEMEHRFYGAVTMFDEHFNNFVAGLQAHAGGSTEDICTDQNLAFSFTRAAVAYDLVESYYFEALDLVGRAGQGMNWEAVAVGNYESDINVLDQIRLEMFRKDRLRVQGEGESLPALLAQYAPGCDPEDMLDQGARTAEADQDAETGIDGGATAGTGGGGGGGGGGELRWERSGEPIIRSDTEASCAGGSMSIEMGVPGLPSVIRPGDAVTVSVPLSWSVSGNRIDGNVIVVAVWFGADVQQSPDIRSFSGSQTLRFTFTMPDSYDFVLPIVVVVGGGITCDGGSGDNIGVNYAVSYFRMGGN